ncbi:MAG TPA: SLBB domain-containing protein [Bacteriovoracaceae bacterium]|nr:SLBB domain-containing protein [Bacteriovoracaceae bacterium]
MMKNHFILPQHPFYNLADYHRAKGHALESSWKLSSQDILVELIASHLRGCGGSGTFTGGKWFTVFQHASPKKYVVVNAADGEPGSFKDRMIIRKNPYAMLEGALIAAHVLKTTDIYIGIKKSFITEIERLQSAIQEFRQAKLLGKIKIHLVAGPEDYLFGEETALLNVIEGSGAYPREAHNPPYELGLFATSTSPNPALVNNVETYARVPEIILRGAESFRNIGTEFTPGTLICTISGDVKRPGVYEVPAGTTLKDVLEIYAGGPSGDAPFKVVLPGVSNRVILREHLNVPLTFEDTEAIGSGLGTRSFIVFDQTRNAVRITEEVSQFLFKESCNQCTACKSGLGVCSISIDGLFTDNEDHTLITRALMAVKSAPQGNRCNLPVQGSVLIPSLVDAFKQEFIDLLEGKIKNPAPIILPLIADFIEYENKFILKDEVSDSYINQHGADKWPKGTYLMDRGTI